MPGCAQSGATFAAPASETDPLPIHLNDIERGVARVGDRAKVVYAEGCKITIGGSWNQDAVTAIRYPRPDTACRREPPRTA